MRFSIISYKTRLSVFLNYVHCSKEEHWQGFAFMKLIKRAGYFKRPKLASLKLQFYAQMTNFCQNGLRLPNYSHFHVSRLWNFGNNQVTLNFCELNCSNSTNFFYSTMKVVRFYFIFDQCECRLQWCLF